MPAKISRRRVGKKKVQEQLFRSIIFFDVHEKLKKNK